MQTVAHHTCNKEGERAYVEVNSPFLSDYIPDKNKLQFLGAGYYFWDDNIEMAHNWGRWHYKNSYFIIECNLHMPQGLFLDLVGNRSHLRYFSNLMSKFEEKGFAREKWTIGAFIEYLKSLERKDPGIFPFKVIRALDLSPKDKELSRFYFVPGKNNYMNIDPRLVICLIEKNSLILRSKTIVFES